MLDLQLFGNEAVQGKKIVYHAHSTEEDYKKFQEIHDIEEYSFWGMEHFLLSCSYEELLWVFIPENWVAMCKNLYEKLQSSGYIKNYKPLGEKKVSSILSKFKDVLNAE